MVRMRPIRTLSQCSSRACSGTCTFRCVLYLPHHHARSLSVATTSSKPPAVLKADIRRVLDRIQVQYKETKTGFDCIHPFNRHLIAAGSARDDHDDGDLPASMAQGAPEILEAQDGSFARPQNSPLLSAARTKKRKRIAIASRQA
jgi:hypothetical protein